MFDDARAVANQVSVSRRRALWILGGGLAAGILLSLILPVRYEAAVTLSPAPASADRAGLSGALATLSGQFGVDVSGARTQLRFYPALVTSDWFLSQLARSPVAGDTTVFEIITGDPLPGGESAALDDAVLKLRDAVSVTLDDRANIFSIAVRAPRRDIALAMATRIIALISDFDRRIRRLRATENRKFIEDRAREAQANLGAAENEVAGFLARNRSYEQSPDLRVAYQRLSRRVDLANDVYITLARNLEQARIDEVKEVPVLTIVDPPHVYWRKVTPQRRKLVLATLFVSMLAVVAWAALDAQRRGEISWGGQRS
jgi:uncharacterized protein involved in exopolysaccharide biosynthesis